MENFKRVTTTSERLKEALRLRDMRQTDLSKATGIDKGSISCYVSGRYEPKNEAVYKMAQALSVSEMWLWGYDVPIERPITKAAPTLGEIISAYRRENNISIEDFAKKSGMTSSLVSALEENRDPNTGKPVQVITRYVMQAAKAMNVNFAELMIAICDIDDLIENMSNLEYVAPEDRGIVAWALNNIEDDSPDDPTNWKPNRIKVYGSVPAGVPIEAVEDVLDWEDVPMDWVATGDKYIGLKVKGDSMAPKYVDGDTVIVKLQPDCESGQDAIVYVNGYDATLKRVIKQPDGIMLQPINPDYEPKKYDYNDERFAVSILGIVVELRRKMV